jgi:hypothetical protein
MIEEKLLNKFLDIIKTQNTIKIENDDLIINGKKIKLPSKNTPNKNIYNKKLRLR